MRATPAIPPEPQARGPAGPRPGGGDRPRYLRIRPDRHGGIPAYGDGLTGALAGRGHHVTPVAVRPAHCDLPWSWPARRPAGRPAIAAPAARAIKAAPAAREPVPAGAPAVRHPAAGDAEKASSDGKQAEGDDEWWTE